MTAIRYNPLTYSENLIKSGMKEETAKVIAQQQEELMVINDQNHATKEDVRLIRKDMELLEMRLQAFMIKSLVSAVSVLGILQGIFHFMK